MTDKRPSMAAPAASAELAHALQTARAALGSESDVERLRVRFESTLGSAPTTLDAAALAKAGRFGMSAAKGWVLLSVATLSICALMYVAPRSSLPKRSPVGRAGPSAWTVARSSSAEPPEMSPQPVVVRSLEAPAVIGDAIGHAAAPRPPHAARLEASARRGEKPVSAIRTAAAPAAALRSDPESEIALVTAAQDALALQPREALALLSEHERLFPQGVLAQERDTLRIDAERALGQTARARGHARAFLAQFPRSPQARALEQWLATPENDSAVHNAQPAPVLTR